MEYLSSLDAAFLDIEDGDRNASLAIASVAIAEGPVPKQREFVDAVVARLPTIPRYRQKVRRVPLDLGPPVWVDDPAFDPARHFRRVPVPAPGDEEALCALVGLIMSERLDRDQPLWQCWVIEGLADGRWAVLSKVHHCLADGVSGNALTEAMFTDSTADTGPVPRTEPEPTTSQLVLDALRGLATDPVEQVRFLAGRLLSPRRLARQIADTAQGFAVMAAALIPAARSTLSGSIGPLRHYEVVHASLPEIMGIARFFEVTVNDVVLAVITGAFRDLLLRRGEKPAADSVRTLVPVSVRNGEGETRVGNQVSLMLPLLPVDIPDPAGRLLAVHHRLATLKARHEPQAGTAATTAAELAAFMPLSWGLRAAARLHQHNVVTVTTNVPGPRQQLSLLGREVIELYPYVPLAFRLRTGVAVLTYRDRMTFGITSDSDTAPEAGLFTKAVEHDIATLVEMATCRQ